MTALPAPDMTKWSILDFELAFDGLRMVGDASVALQNQPRASDGRHGYYPGASLIVDLGEVWCATMIDNIMDRLLRIRFPDPKHDERRVRLLVHYATMYGQAGEGMAEVLRMASEQLVVPAA
jgi:hypothetical protein